MSPMPLAEAKAAWLHADCVCFDVDSTVCVDEGLDNLAEFCGVADRVKVLTNKAMNGEMTFEEAFQARLEMMGLTRQKVEQFVRENPPKLTPHVGDLVRQLESSGKHVYLVTGGISHLVEPVLAALNLQPDRLISNRLDFDPDSGAFLGHDRSAFTSRSGGKPAAVRHLKETRGYRSIAFVGDGATDLEARSECQLFVGFGGNVTRQRVKDAADWFVDDFQCLIEALNGSNGVCG